MHPNRIPGPDSARKNFLHNPKARKGYTISLFEVQATGQCIKSTTEAFDNSKNPVACFEGLRSIFRGHGEKETGMQEKPEASREQAFTFV